MRASSVLVLAALVVLPASATLVAGVPVVDEAPWGAWVNHSIPGSIGETRMGEVTVGPDGIVHASWSRDNSLYYGRFDGLFWEVTMVSPTGWQPWGIAIDPKGQLNIGFWSGAVVPEPELANAMLAKFDGTSWSTETIRAEGNVGSFGRLRIGTDGIPRAVLYERLPVGQLPKMHYCWKPLATWDCELVDTGILIWMDLDLDSTNTPHIANTNSAGTWGKSAHYTRIGINSWSKEIANPSAGSDISIAIDSQDRIHLSYRGVGETLAYSLKDASGWHHSVLDTEPRTGWATAIDTDSQDRPHIAYWQVMNTGFPDDPTRGHARYATQFATGTWSLETIDPGLSSLDMQIALDPTDRPFVIYRYLNDHITHTRSNEFRLAYPATAPLGKLGI